MGLATTFYGAGRHIDGISQHDLGMWLKVSSWHRPVSVYDTEFGPKLYYVCMCLYLYVAMSVKISLLVFFMRIFSKSEWHSCFVINVTDDGHSLDQENIICFDHISGCIHPERIARFGSSMQPPEGRIRPQRTRQMLQPV